MFLIDNYERFISLIQKVNRKNAIENQIEMNEQKWLNIHLLHVKS